MASTIGGTVRAVTAQIGQPVVTGAEAERKVSLWIAFIWYRLLTSAIGEDRADVAAYMRLIAGHSR